MGCSLTALRVHLPCPCGTSSDAYTEYANGGHCFSCNKSFFNEADETTWTAQYVTLRGISRDTMAFYGVRTMVDPAGTARRVVFPYAAGIKTRELAGKTFKTHGEMKGGQLFGQGRFQAGSAKSITITEGEFDTLAAFQMLGKYPVVSIRSSSTAKKDCADNYDYLNSFEKIYLCFDGDECGMDATKAVAGLFDFNKIYHVKLTKYKDANEFLEKADIEEFRKSWWNAQRFLPDDIISSFSVIDDLIDNEIIVKGTSYPWPLLQSMTYGMRPGEFILITALEGRGKTEIIRAIEHKVLKEVPDSNVGIIHLEEGKLRAIKGLAGLELKQPVHLPDWQGSKEEIKNAYHTVAGRDNRVHFYSHFGSDDPAAIMGMVQFLAGPCNCKFIFLDHVSMVVSGIDTEDERRALDWISTRLKMMAESHGVTIVCVSHVNDNGLTRGSRNIAKVADLHIHLDRDVENPDLRVRNTTKLMVRKNRFGAKTGPAGELYFDFDTFTLTPAEEAVNLPF